MQQIRLLQFAESREYTVNHLLNPRGAYLFQIHFKGGLTETRGAFERGYLFNLAKTMVLILHKELEYKVEKLKYKKLEVMQPRIKNKFEIPVD